MSATLTESTAPSITPEATMAAVLEAYPGARRALFRKYHIGGCSSCGFQPTETLAEVCRRNNLSDVPQVIAHLQAGHELDARLWVSPLDLAAWLRQPDPPRLLDIRSREEWEAARVPGAELLTNDLLQALMGEGRRQQAIVVCDHQGVQALDAAAYLLGHGFEQVRCLRGGVDAWSLEVDPTLPRYELA